MALPPAFLDELRARTPLPALIGRKTRLTRAGGRNWKGCCPFHNEKTPSFHVYDDHFHCFGCGAHGDAVTFVMRAEGASFPEAVERLATEAGLEVPKPTPQAAERERRARDLHAVLEAAASAFQRRLRLPEGAPALDYLRRRGLTDETIRRFGLGWSGAGRGALAADLKSEGIEPDQLVEAGLVRPQSGLTPPEAGEGAAPRDFFFNRVMFPIRDRRGRMIAFGGRTLGDGQPKYVNSPETPLFQKRRALYGLDLAREAAFRGAAVVAVEGYMDVIALHQAGFGGAVAPLGTALTQEQLQTLWQITPEPVLCFDGDDAGGRAAVRAIKLAVPLLAADRTLRFATLDRGEDPDTLVAKRGASGFQAILDGAKRIEDRLLAALREDTGDSNPNQRAALLNAIDAACRSIADRALGAELRNSLRSQYFNMYRHRPKGPIRKGAVLTVHRFPPSVEIARLEQARCLLAIIIRHPWLLADVEESLFLLDLPDGPATRLRSAILAWHAGAEALDSPALIAHLAESGAAEDLAWALRGPGLPVEAAAADAQPAEAEKGWWHFFLRLRGEAGLVEDQREAQRLLVETNDPAVQQRLIRLNEALLALRSGDTGTAAEPGGGEAAGADPIG